MTETSEGLDQASLDRIARLQERRASATKPAATKPAAARPARRKRRHAALGGRIAAAGVGASTMLGITAVLALDAAANSAGGSPELGLAPIVSPLAPSSAIPDHLLAPASANPGETVIAGTPPEVIEAAAQTEDGFDLAALAGLSDLPDGAIITGAQSESGRSIIVVVHQGVADPAAPSAPAAPVAAAATAAAPAPVAAPTQLTATPVVREVAVPAPAPAPAAKTSGS